MKTTSILLAVLALTGSLVAQRPDQKQKGWLGKELPQLRGHESSDSRWLGSTTALSKAKKKGQPVLVVLTNYG